MAERTIPEMVTIEAMRQGVDPQLALAVAQQESGFKQEARSPAGAIGVMQLMPATARGLGVNPEILEENIRGGVQYLKQLQGLYPQDRAKQLAAYNAGPGAVARKDMVPANKETLGYVLRVMNNLVSPRSAAAAELSPPRASTTADINAELTFPDERKPLPAISGLSPARAAAGDTLPRTPIAMTPPQIPRTMRDINTELTFPDESSGESSYPPPEDPRWKEAQVLLDREDALLKGKGFTPAGAAGLAINIVLPSVGSALGKFAIPYIGKIAPFLGEIGGNFLARKTNVAIGAEEPGMLGDIASVAVPTVIRGYENLKPAVIKRLHGASVALHEQAAEDLQRLPDMLIPPVPSEQLYAQAAQQNPMIRPSNIWQNAQEVLRREQRLQPTMRNARVANIAEDLHQLIRDNGGQLPLQALKEHQQRLGLLIRQASRENWPETTALRQMYKAFYDDLEHAATQGVAGAALLRQANRAARAEFAMEDLATMFAPGHPGIATRADGLVQLNGGKLRDTFEKRLAQDELFRGSLTSDQIDAIRLTFSAIERLPRLPPTRGTSYGAGMALARGGTAYAITQALTHNPVAAGLAGAAASAAPHYLAAALMTPRGRAWLVRNIRTQGGLTPEMLGLLSGGGRQMMEQGTTVLHEPFRQEEAP